MGGTRKTSWGVKDLNKTAARIMGCRSQKELARRTSYSRIVKYMPRRVSCRGITENVMGRKPGENPTQAIMWNTMPRRRSRRAIAEYVRPRTTNTRDVELNET